MILKRAFKADFRVIVLRYSVILNSVFWVTCSDKSCITNCIVDAINCIINEMNDDVTIINAT